MSTDPPRQCDAPGCGNPAVVHITQVVDNESTTHRLCRECARARGIDTDSEPEVKVAQLLSHLDEARLAPSASEPAPCEGCGMSFSRFRKSGRLGCAQCYAAFEERLRRLLRRIHSSSSHRGKVHLPPDAAAWQVRKRLTWLRRMLRYAIEQEDFESAAVFRDKIRAGEAENVPDGDRRGQVAEGLAGGTAGGVAEADGGGEP